MLSVIKAWFLEGGLRWERRKVKWEQTGGKQMIKSRLSKSRKTMILAHSPLCLDIVPIPVQIKPTPFWGWSAEATDLPPIPVFSALTSFLCLVSLPWLYWACRSSTARAKHPQKHLKIFSRNQPALLIRESFQGFCYSNRSITTIVITGYMDTKGNRVHIELPMLIITF